MEEKEYEIGKMIETRNQSILKIETAIRLLEKIPHENIDEINQDALYDLKEAIIGLKSIVRGKISNLRD